MNGNERGQRTGTTNGDGAGIRFLSYLFLARSEGEAGALAKNVALQKRCGVPTEMITPTAAQRIVPELVLDGVVAASYNPRDGVVFPWPTAIHIRNDGSFDVKTSKGTVRAQRVVNAAGAWSPEVSRMVGVELPNHPHRHEILSTEPLKPFLKPMVALLSSGLYFSQSMRGEIVTGINVPDEAQGVQLGSRLRFLTRVAEELVKLVPRFARLKVLRQWAGPYDVSPDGRPILGEALPGFYLCCGFVGHGFMMAPVVARIYAEWLSGGRVHPLFQECRLSRFAEGSTLREEMILG